MSTPATRHQPPATPASDDEVLVRVDGVGKKFCRSLKKSLWYGVCDIAGELLPRPKRQRVTSSKLRVTGEAEQSVAGSELLVASGNTSAVGANLAEGENTRHQLLVTVPKAVPDSGRRRHQCLGLISHNGAWTQAAGQPLGRLPEVARRVRRRGKARINTTLLKMLNALIKPDRGTITMQGRGGR